MKSRYCKQLTIIILIIFCAKITFAQTNYNDILGQKKANTITTSVPFLMIAPDARGGALGDAGVANTPDVNSMHWNPAKYAFIDKDLGVALSYSPWLRKLVDDIDLAYLVGYKKINDMHAIAGSLRYFSLGEINFTDEFGNPIGNYSPNEFAVDIAYARKFSDKISGGIAGRYINSSLTGGIFVGGVETKPGYSIATDVSAYYQDKVKLGNTNGLLGVGVNISNIGAKIAYSITTERHFIPINLRLGPSLKLDLDEYNTLAFSTDFNKLLVPTPPIYKKNAAGMNVDLDGDGRYDLEKGRYTDVSVVSGIFGSFSDAPGGFNEELREITYSLGAEYWYAKQFALRSGLFWEDETKGNRKYVTLGIGLRYNVFGIDFSYLVPLEQHNPLENTLRFSLLLNFDAFKEGEAKKK